MAEDRIRSQVAWLADAPLYIDRSNVEALYDAVVRPDAAEGTTTLTITEANKSEIAGKLGLGAELTTGELAMALVPVFAFLKPTVKAEGEAQLTVTKETTGDVAVELHPIRTAQRQLEQLAFHYLVNLRDRVKLVDDPSSLGWRQEDFIGDTPRALVFLDLPGETDQPSGWPGTKLIPTAAEFEGGDIVQIYSELKGRDNSAPPEYPQPKRGKTETELRRERRAYWQWFEENFSATKAMIAIEEAAKGKGGLRWIDYRLPLNQEGDTLHLHVVPAGEHDIGVFAYNMVKRGEKHGLRLVGTLRSEPDLNVLAVFDK